MVEMTAVLTVCYLVESWVDCLEKMSVLSSVALMV